MMKRETCCFTGHRDLFFEDSGQIRRRLEREVVRLISLGVRVFAAGGALGFDTLAAQAVLKLRDDYPQIRLVLVLPCRNQAACWEEQDQRVYEQIKKHADEVAYTAERYFRGCMHKRNRVLAAQSGWCICWLTRGTGGTAYTVNLCRAQGVRVINLAEKSFNN